MSGNICSSSYAFLKRQKLFAILEPDYQERLFLPLLILFGVYSQLFTFLCSIRAIVNLYAFDRLSRIFKYFYRIGTSVHELVTRATVVETCLER